MAIIDNSLIEELNTTVINSGSAYRYRIEIIEDTNTSEPTLMAIYKDADPPHKPTSINNKDDYTVANTVLGTVNLETGYIEFMNGLVIQSLPDNEGKASAEIFTYRAIELSEGIETYLMCLTNELNEVFPTATSNKNVTFQADKREHIITAYDENKNIIGTANIVTSEIDMGNDNVTHISSATSKDIAYVFLDKVCDKYEQEHSTKNKEPVKKQKNDLER